MKFTLPKIVGCSLLTIIVITALKNSLQVQAFFFTASAWVVKENMLVGQTITPELLIKKRIEKKQIYGSVQNKKVLIGKVLAVSKSANNTIYWHELDH
jgi:hypothetical protein